MNGFDVVELHGGPLDGERREIRRGLLVKTFVVPVENRPTGPLGFPLVIGHDYALDETGAWRYVNPTPPPPIPSDVGAGS